MEMIKNYQDLVKQIEQIAHRYFTFLSKKHRHTSNSIYYLNKVLNAYIPLSSIHKLVINNDFFFNDYPYWWTNKFTKEEYNSLKYQSMICFLNNYLNA